MTTPMHKFAVEYHGDGAVLRQRVNAEYVKVEDGMVVFKDRGHGIVFMLPPHQLVSVSRVDAPVNGEVTE